MNTPVRAADSVPRSFGGCVEGATCLSDAIVSYISYQKERWLLSFIWYWWRRIGGVRAFANSFGWEMTIVRYVFSVKKFGGQDADTLGDRLLVGRTPVRTVGGRVHFMDANQTNRSLVILQASE